ncbi:replication-relaxation family protein [Bacillus wiedmannii]|uniref:replication-relaxation family protein n=2 Tax=Bacillus wiedmannii TaxID=1890302 RepID=UPI001E554A41|nr:replication-relaxation family protein [Bacillus wiedmannii]MCC2425350.1 replication-relaxation family protein [Bacillus wiedmannii]
MKLRKLSRLYDLGVMYRFDYKTLKIKQFNTYEKGMCHMVERDINIINDLTRFRVMKRDQILKLHFKKNANNISNGNNVLKRLVDRNYITVNKTYRPHIYFPNPATIKLDSTKIQHFLSIGDLYVTLCEVQQPRSFIVEPKYAKGHVEPDALIILENSLAIFVEIQLSRYTSSMIRKKFLGYKELYKSGIIKKETWQPSNKIIYPPIVLISDYRYEIDVPGLKILQYQSIQQFIDHVNKKSVTKNKRIITQH